MAKEKQEKSGVDYKALYFMGITFVGVGVVFLSAVNKVLGGALMVIGFSNMIIGWKHKSEWKKK